MEDRRTVTIALTGGLGNQLFQLAAALYLAENGTVQILNHGMGAITSASAVFDKYAPHQLNVEFAIKKPFPNVMTSNVWAEDKF